MDGWYGSSDSYIGCPALCRYRFLHIMKAEATGPTTEKLVPKLGQTAKILYTIYIVMTSMQIIFLLTAGMPLYDSLIHAFGSAATGVFQTEI